MKKNKLLRFLVDYLKSIAILLILSTLTLLLIHQFKFTYHNLSDAIFIPNILAFIVSIGINFGASNIMNPMKYTLRRYFRPKKTREEYVDYADYLDEKRKTATPVWHFTLATLTLLIIAYIFTLV